MNWSKTSNKMFLSKKISVYFFAIIAFLNASNVYAEIKITVDKTGNGNFTTIQEAINSVRAFDPAGSTTIVVKNGIYKEKLVIPEHICNIKILGEDKEQTIITYNDHANINKMGTFRTYTLQVRGNDITLENLTIENNAERLGQAVALHTEGDRIWIKNCKLLGNQDTFYAAGENRRIYVENSYIEGTTDFIFGGATVWFEYCDIYCKQNSYITAASTAKTVKYGFIFNNCKINVAENVTSMFLGRPWRAYGMTVFMNCELPKEINPKGWHNWDKQENEKTARYFEYNNSGEGSKITQRVTWVKILSKRESKKITKEKVLNDFFAKITQNQY